MLISDWRSDVCSSDLRAAICPVQQKWPSQQKHLHAGHSASAAPCAVSGGGQFRGRNARGGDTDIAPKSFDRPASRSGDRLRRDRRRTRSEEHTSELQSLMRISYAVFCLKKKNT